MKKFYFPINYLKCFLANVKQREDPGFGMLCHIYLRFRLSVMALLDNLVTDINW